MGIQSMGVEVFFFNRYLPVWPSVYREHGYGWACASSFSPSDRSTIFGRGTGTDFTSRFFFSLWIS